MQIFNILELVLSIMGIAIWGFLVWKTGLKEDKELKLILLLQSISSLMRSI